MKKLLTLLNEYEKENGRNFEVKEIGMTYRNNDLMFISKRYGFIKRLVENDKIDFEKVKDNSELYIKFSCNDSEKLAFSKIILMLLSISDTPIEDLISYLK